MRLCGAAGGIAVPATGIRRRSAVCLASIALAIALAGTGCTALDRAELSSFHPFSTGRFEYRASTTLFYDASPDGWAEAERLDWLRSFVDTAAICPLGYHIVSRQVVFRYASPLGYSVDDIVYQGICRS